MNIAAIVPAAGYSSRMETLKPLLSLEGMPVLERVVNLFQSAGIDDIRVVVGFRKEDIMKTLARLTVQWITNDHFQDGMFSSVVAGVKSLGPDHDAFFVLPVDIPLVRRQTLMDLMAAYQNAPSRILHPTMDGRRGHPPLIPAAYGREIAEWQSAGGLRSFLEHHENGAQNVEVADECIHLDMDTPSSYHCLINKLNRYDIPTEAECRILMRLTFGVTQQVMDHGREVARLACNLAGALNTRGYEFDLELIRAAGLLHDLARGKPDHAAQGARILRDLGYSAVANLVETHMDILVQDEGPISEGEILYLADKQVQEGVAVDLKTRFNEKMSRYAGNPKAQTAMAKRLENALKIKERIEKVVGKGIGD